MEHLSAAEFPAPEIVRTRRRETSVFADGHVYELQRQIPGKLGDRMCPAQVDAAARALGRYHKLVDGFDHPGFHRERRRCGLMALAGILERLDEACRRPLPARARDILSRLDDKAQELAVHLSELDSLPHLVIHGDYYAGNILFRDDRVTGVVDYDKAHWSARALEVAEATIYFAQEPTARFQRIVYSSVLDLDSLRRFLTAYAEIVCLTKAEIRALPHLVGTVWLCASLDPPLAPRLRLDGDLEPLLEVLALAEWARDHRREIENTGFVVFGMPNRG
jgi:Ser/Thr protein kinase RdoA (MazF antagonist)